MAISLLDKLTNFLAPAETMELQPEAQQGPGLRKSHLRLQAGLEPVVLHVVVCLPLDFDDVCLYADYLKLNMAVILNCEGLDLALQQRISDFMNGVCSVTGGKDQRISNHMILYTPSNVAVSKELYAYSIPPYGKQE